jgi:hypothetical protein
MGECDALPTIYKSCIPRAKIVVCPYDFRPGPSPHQSNNTLIRETFITYVMASLPWHYSCKFIKTHRAKVRGEIDLTMGNVALKHICLWMFLLLLFFLLLYGVHLFFFSRAESRIEQKQPETRSSMGNHILSTTASIIMEQPHFVRNEFFQHTCMGV